MKISPALSESPDIILTEVAGLRTRSGVTAESKGRNMLRETKFAWAVKIHFQKKMDVTENKYTAKRKFPQKCHFLDAD